MSDQPPAATPGPSNLPIPLTRLVGRETELAAVESALREARLVTLVGPPGCGKTRLAIEIGRQISAQGVPAVWCDFNPLADPALVAGAVASVLKVPEAAGGHLLTTIAEAVGDQPLLLLFDNCEHVLTAAATLASALLSAAPKLQVLATSLQVLGIPGERRCPIAGLEFPPRAPQIGAPAEPSTLAVPSVALFLERAGENAAALEADVGTLTAVGEICRRLEGLPLAIELAAARSRMLSVKEIAASLDNVLDLLALGPPAAPARHQTLEALMAWSYDLLSESEQQMLRRMSVFSGSFTLAAAAEVCLATDDTAAALRGASGLTERALLVIDPPEPGMPSRFRLLETVRQYARVRLEESGEGGEVRSRLLAWAAALAERLAPTMVGSGQTEATRVIDQEYDHIRSALRWAVTARQTELGMRLANALFRYWLSRDRMGEARSWYEELLNADEAVSAAGGPAAHPAVRAHAAYGSGRLACRQGDDRTGAMRGEECLRLANLAEDLPGIARGLDLLALVAQDRGEFERAVQLHEQALEQRRALDDPYGLAVSLNNLGIVLHDMGDFRRAASCYQEALERAQRADIRMLPALNNLAEVARLLGDYDRSRQVYGEALEIAAKQSSLYELAMAYLGLGACARDQGQPADAERYLAEAERLHHKMGTSTGIAEVALAQGRLALDQGALPRADSLASRALELCREAEFERGVAESRILLARISGSQGDLDASRQHLSLALDILRAGTRSLTLVEAFETCVQLRCAGPRLAARLATHVRRQRQASGTPLPIPERAAWDKAMLILRQEIPEPEWNRLQAESTQWTGERLLADLVAERSETETPFEALTGPEAPPRQLAINALGVARVFVDGQPVSGADWTYAKSRELFFYLLTQGPATKARIGLDLWPEASERQLRNDFHRALYHARRAVDLPEIVHYVDGVYAFDRSVSHTYDVERFEALLLAAKEHEARGALGEAAESLQACVQLWQGDFLQDVDAGDWVVVRREELRRNYLEALIRLGQFRLAEARFDTAEQALQTAIRFDPYFEASYRELMRCHARKGEAGQALKVFGALRSLLLAELAAEPSPETTLLCERIRRGDDV